MPKLLRKMSCKWERTKRFLLRVEPAAVIIGATASILIWAYSNFATANEVSEAKAELRTYVDQRHGDVKEDLNEIKAMLSEQRAMQNRILLKLSR